MALYRQMVMDLESALKEDILKAREILRAILGEIIIQSEGAEVWAELKTNPAAAANSGFLQWWLR